MIDFRFLEHGIQVRGQWFPILKMQWGKGLALNAFVPLAPSSSRWWNRAGLEGNPP